MDEPKMNMIEYFKCERCVKETEYCEIPIDVFAVFHNLIEHYKESKDRNECEQKLLGMAKRLIKLLENKQKVIKTEIVIQATLF